MVSHFFVALGRKPSWLPCLRWEIMWYLKALTTNVSTVGAASAGMRFPKDIFQIWLTSPLEAVSFNLTSFFSLKEVNAKQWGGWKRIDFAHRASLLYTRSVHTVHNYCLSTHEGGRAISRLNTPYDEHPTGLGIYVIIYFVWLQIVLKDEERGEAELRAKRLLNCEKRKNYKFDIAAVSCVGDTSDKYVNLSTHFL